MSQVRIWRGTHVFDTEVFTNKGILYVATPHDETGFDASMLKHMLSILEQPVYLQPYKHAAEPIVETTKPC